EADGIITDNEGNIITRFRTFHDGMGFFGMNPIISKKYVARINGIDKDFQLPEAREGYLLRVIESGPDLKVIAYNGNGSMEYEPMLVAQTRGNITYAATFKASGKIFSVNIPKKTFPSGITQITLFDNEGIPRC